MDAAFNYAVNGPFGWIVRPVRDFVRAGAGADVQARPTHGLPVSTPSTSPPTRSKRNSTPSPVSSALPTPSPPPHIPADKKLQRKRKCNHDKISDFISMLIEAVDRDEARQQLEKHRAELAAKLDETRKTVNRESLRIEFLKHIASGYPALERVLMSTEEGVAEFKELIEEWKEQREFLNTRLCQSKDQLSQLIQRLYEDLDHLLYSLDGQKIPPFVDKDGNERTNVQMDESLAEAFRYAQESRVPLQHAEDLEKRSREKWNKAFKSTQAAASIQQRTSREQHKNKRRKLWLSDREEYETLLRHQQESERELLSVHAKDFLVRNGLMSVPSKLDEVSDAGDGQDSDEDDDDDDDGGDVDADNGNKPSAGPGTELPIDKLIKQWLDRRKDLANCRRELEEYRKSYDMKLADYIYAFPMTDISDFDSWMLSLHHTDLETLEAKVTDAKERYDMAREMAREELSEEELPMTPDFFDPGEDVAPSQASDNVPSNWEDNRDNKERKRATINFINRYVRRMKRAKIDGGLVEVSDVKERLRQSPYLETGEEDPYRVPALESLGDLAPEDRDAELLDPLETELSPRTINKLRRKKQRGEGSSKK